MTAKEAVTDIELTSDLQTEPLVHPDLEKTCYGVHAMMERRIKTSVQGNITQSALAQVAEILALTKSNTTFRRKEE